MITVLLEKIITILEGWIQSFTSHAQHVEDKLDSLDQTASDIKTNTDPISDIADNTGAVITPIQNIKSNTDSIKQSSQTSANNTTAILNNVSTLSTNTGRAAAFAEDCANNTLDIKDKVTTIASDTTQIRANTAAIEDIKDLMQYYFINTIVTEDSEGVIANFDTDLEDYLLDLKVTIPADPTGYTGITLTKCGKNIFNLEDCGFIANNIILGGYFSGNTQVVDNSLYLDAGTYTISSNAPFTAWYLYDINGQFGIKYNSNFMTFTLTEDKYMAIRCYKSGVSTKNDFAQFNIQFEKSNVITPYEPYKAMTYPVSFGSTITDGAEADLLSGLIKVNTTPESFIQIQRIAVRTYKGVNNIVSDVGSTALTYRETLKKYLEKHNQ